MTEQKQQKFCKDCDDWLDTELFYSDKNTLDGLSFYCKKHYRKRKSESKNQGILNDVATLINENVIKNTRLERIAADLLIKSCMSRMNGEFPCQWDNRLDFARDCILKIDGFWKEWLRLTKAWDKETNPTEKENMRANIDRIVENPSIGYRLENIQPLSKLENVLKTVRQRYDVIKWESNIILSNQTKNEIIKKYSLNTEELKKIIDGGLYEIEGELYLFQSKDRSQGKHADIIKELSKDDDDIPEEYIGHMVLEFPLKVRLNDGKIVDAIGSQPVVYDKRYVSAKISIKKEKKPSNRQKKATEKI